MRFVSALVRDEHLGTCLAVDDDFFWPSLSEALEIQLLQRILVGLPLVVNLVLRRSSNVKGFSRKCAEVYKSKSKSRHKASLTFTSLSPHHSPYVPGPPFRNKLHDMGYTGLVVIKRFQESYR